MSDLDVFKRCANNVPPEIKLEVDLLYDLSDRINSIMDAKNISIEDITNKLDMSTKEVCGILSGTYDINISTIAKLTILLKESLIKIVK
jgi:hypothetical protein